MSEHRSPPRARKDGLLEETAGEELLLYDQNSHTAHCLSPIAACIWRHCDGEHDLTELAEFAGVSKNLVADALHELHEKDLLASEPTFMQSTIPGVSRREAIGRGVRYGAAATGAALIVSATAATPAMASSEEKPKTCTPVAGTLTSCCECENRTCIQNSSITTEAQCIEECNKHGGKKFWAKEGDCK
jgi:hypothetical protein